MTKDKKWTIETDISLKIRVAAPSIDILVKIAPTITIALNYLIH